MGSIPQCQGAQVTIGILRQNLLSSSLYESQIESYEHQDNSDVRDQPSPELTFEEQEIYANDDGYPQHQVKADNYVSFHVILSLYEACKRRAIGSPPRFPVNVGSYGCGSESKVTTAR